MMDQPGDPLRPNPGPPRWLVRAFVAKLVLVTVATLAFVWWSHR